jgi:hypothetical protein
MKPSEIEEYFRQAAISHKVLAHESSADRKTFRRYNIKEILEDTRTNLKGISLVLEAPRKRGEDMLSDNKRKKIQLAFLVIKHVEKGDYEAETLALDETEEISEQIIAKIINDVRKYQENRSHPWKLKGFDPNSIRQMEVRNLFDGWLGWRTELELNQTFENNLVLKDEDWSNDTAWTF